MPKFAISVALGLSLFFTLGFLFSQENKSIWTSVIYGLIGGGSAYYLVAWWQNDEKPEAPIEPDMIPFSKDINKMLIKTKLVKPENTKAQRPNRASSILEWLLKSDKSPPRE